MSVGILLNHVIRNSLKLPKEYQEVTTIRSSGGSGKPYIDTGYTPNNNTRVKASMQWYSNSNSAWGGFGAATSATSRAFETYSYSNALNICFGSHNIGADTSGHWNVTLYHLYEIDFNKRVYTAKDNSDNGASKTWTMNASTFTAPYTMYLFGSHRATPSYAEICFCGKVLIWDNDVLVRYLVPCYRKSDDVIGYYDLVNDKFYSSPTGRFWRDVAVKKLPNAYQQVDSITSSGTQYIDTGLDISGGYRIHARMTMANQSDQNDTFFGTENSADPYGSVCVRKNGTGTNLQYLTGNGGVNGTMTATDSDPTVELKAQGSASSISRISAWQSDVSASGSYPTTISSNPLFIFGANLGGTAGRMVASTLKEFTVWDGNNKMIGDFVPCYRKSDNEIGLYDTVQHRFLTNAGTGAFTKGGNVYSTIEKIV